MSNESPVGYVLVALSVSVAIVFDVSFISAFAASTVVVIVATLVGVASVRELDDQDEADDDPVAVRRAREAYVDGRIDERELERRLERAFDTDLRRIRRRFEPIDDVGPKTCRALADRFGTVDAIEQATADDLEQVDGIGPKRAAKIADGRDDVLVDQDVAKAD